MTFFSTFNSILLNSQSICSLMPYITCYITKGLTEEPSGKSDSGTVKQRKMSKKNTEEEPKARVLTSTNSDRCRSTAVTSDWEGSSAHLQFFRVPQVGWQRRQRSGRPAALLVQFGRRAGGGRAAAREPVSPQCICHPSVLRGGSPGPEVKTIHPCTALSSHPCTVTVLFKGVFGYLAFNLFYWIIVLFIFIYI